MIALLFIVCIVHIGKRWGNPSILQKRLTPADGGPSTCLQDPDRRAVNPLDCTNITNDWWKTIGEKPDWFGFANGYGGNPFQDFIDPNRPDEWTNITPNAFYAVVGAWVIQQKARMAWVANMISRHQILQHKSGGLFRKKITTTLNAYTKPRWTLITPPQVPLDAALHLDFKMSDGQIFTDGKNAYVRHEGVYSNLPHQELLTYTYSQSKSAWTGLAMFVFSFVISAMIPGLGQLFSAAGGATATAGGAAAMGAGTAFSSSALTSGLIGGLANLGWNLANGVSPGDAADRVFATGKDPLNISGLPGGFDYRKGVHDKMIASDPGQNIKKTPGATGDWFDKWSLTHKEHFVTGRDLHPGDQITTTDYATRAALELQSWLNNQFSQMGIPPVNYVQP